MKKIFSLSADVMLIMAFAAVLFTIIGFLIGINWHSNMNFYQGDVNGTYVSGKDMLSFDADKKQYFLSAKGAASQQGMFESLDDNTVHMTDGPLEGSIAVFDGGTVKVVNAQYAVPYSASWEKTENYITTIG